LDKYTVKLMPRAYRDLDEIYVYIAAHIGVKETAVNLIDELEKSNTDVGFDALSRCRTKSWSLRK